MINPLEMLPASGAGAISPPPSHPSPATNGTQPLSSDNNPPPPQRPQLRCPRCDSTNTKFCYYNNYSLSQPRHFCKSCRRYWTHGGALRNVPIGGGSRKSKKSRSGALKLFQGGIGITSSAPVVGNLSTNPFSLYHQNPNPNHLSPFGFGGGLNLNLPGPNFNNNPNTSTNNNNGQDLLASSIESLSSLNQELHWKLQQQRMAVLYDNCTGGGAAENENESVTTAAEKKQQPNLFQNYLEVTNPAHTHPPPPEVGMHHQWFFDASYGGGGGASMNDIGNASRLNAVLDKDGVINFQPCPQWLGVKKV